MVPLYSTPFFRTIATKLFNCLVNAFKGFLLGSNESPAIDLLTPVSVYKSYEQKIKRGKRGKTLSDVSNDKRAGF